jgi:hypothetical protein
MTSEKLLQLIKERVYPDLYIFPDKYAPIDAYSFEKNLWIEVKARTEFYYWIMIEKHKYNKIVNIRKSRYVIVMPDDYGNDKIYSFNFNELPKPIWKLEDRPVSNENPNGNWEKVPVAYFHVKQGKDITSLLLE